MKQVTINLPEPVAIKERQLKHRQIFNTTLLMTFPLGLVVFWGALTHQIPVYLILYTPLIILVVSGLMDRQRLLTSRYETLLILILCVNGININILRLIGQTGADVFANHSVYLIVVGIGLFQHPKWVMATAIPYVLFHMTVSAIVIGRQPSSESWITLLMTFTTLMMFTLLYYYRHWWEESHRSERIYQTLAYTDDLTTLPNRRALHDIWQSYDFLDDTAVMMVDIDHFKKINDVYGHPEGDRLLWIVGQVIHQQLGAMPHANAPQPVVGRWGGEEFLIFLPQTTQMLAYMMAEVIRESIETANVGVPLTISIGVAFRRPEELLPNTTSRADIALYKAKQTGRNCVEMYHEDELDQSSTLRIQQ